MHHLANQKYDARKIVMHAFISYSWKKCFCGIKALAEQLKGQINPSS
jgi:hypothetical protein